MSDYHQLWRTLFLVKDYLIEYKIDGFSSFDLTEKDIDNLHKEKGYDCFDNISLLLVV
jgi:hypothetical protein